MYLVLYVRDFWKIVLLTYFVACLQKPANPSWELLDVAVVPRSHSTILTTVWDSSWYLAFVIFSFFERSEFLIATSQKKSLRVCPCVRLILVLVGKTLILVSVWGVPDMYVPGISRQKSYLECLEKLLCYVAVAVLAADADADAAVLVANMTPPYVRQKRLLAG